MMSHAPGGGPSQTPTGNKQTDLIIFLKYDFQRLQIKGVSHELDSVPLPSLRVYMFNNKFCSNQIT